MRKRSRKTMVAAVLVSLLLGTCIMVLPGVARAQEAFIGEIRMFAGNFAPRGWAFCHGQLLRVEQYTPLFALLGNTYGGDGRTTFAVPDLRGRVVVGTGRGPGLSDYRLGMKGGWETVRLTVNQMPAHGHPAQATVNASSEEGNSAVPTKNVWAKTPGGALGYSTASNTAMGGAVNVTVGQAGGGQPHENRPPYQVINFIICLQGIFPPRS